MLHEDFFIRQVRRAAEALARAVANKQSGDLHAAFQETEDALGEWLGPNLVFLDVLDARSLARLMGDDPERIKGVADTCSIQAEILDAQGDAVTAKKRRASAKRLLRVLEDCFPQA